MTAKELATAAFKQSGCATRKQWYREVYLYSQHWTALREEAFKTHGKKCNRCPATSNLDVHHLRYGNIYDVTVADLEILCRPCHNKEHPEKEKSPRRGKSPKKRSRKRNSSPPIVHPSGLTKKQRKLERRARRIARMEMEAKDGGWIHILERLKKKHGNSRQGEAKAIRELLGVYGEKIPRENRNQLKKQRKSLETRLDTSPPMVSFYESYLAELDDELTRKFLSDP